MTYPQERRTITLTDYGDPEGFTAMAKGVGFPVAIAAKLVLEGNPVLYVHGYCTSLVIHRKDQA